MLVVLDGCSLTLTDEQRNKGFGNIGGRGEQAQGVKVTNTVALNTQGEVLGFPAQRYSVRTGPAKRHGYRPAHGRESVHWRLAVAGVSDRFAFLAQKARLHFIADCEADASLPPRHSLQLGNDFTIRAYGTRTLRLGGRRVGLRP